MCSYRHHTIQPEKNSTSWDKKRVEMKGRAETVQIPTIETGKNTEEGAGTLSRLAVISSRQAPPDIHDMKIC